MSAKSIKCNKASYARDEGVGSSFYYIQRNLIVKEKLFKIIELSY